MMTLNIQTYCSYFSISVIRNENIIISLFLRSYTYKKKKIKFNIWGKYIFLLVKRFD